MIRNISLPQQAHDALTRAFQDMADTACRDYPQYAGYHNRYVLWIVTEDTTFKGGTTMHAGEIVLGTPDLNWPEGCKPTITVFNHHNGFHVGFPPESLRRVRVAPSNSDEAIAALRARLMEV